MKPSSRVLAFVVAILFSVSVGCFTYAMLHRVNASVEQNQREKDVVTYNDGFIDGENSIIDQCEKVSDPTLSATWYKCPIPVVDR